jgi:hypothetical protein
MPAHRIPCVYLALVTLLGALSGSLGAAGHSGALDTGVAWLLLSAVAPYVWFYLDSAERGFPRTYAWSAATILMPVVALPLYLARSRPAGRRARAVGKCMAVCALSVVLPMIAELAFSKA